jgi:putative phosphoribosyl transferase
MDERSVRVHAGQVVLEGDLVAPPGASGIVVFAHGSGSSRHSPRNRYVAGVLQAGGLATLLIDLLTPEEEAVDLRTAHLRFDIGLLAARLVGASDWLVGQPATRDLRVGYFGASTGGGAARRGGRAAPRCPRGRLSRRSAGSGRSGVVAGAGADAAHCRGARHASDRDERGGAGAARRRQAA